MNKTRKTVTTFKSLNGTSGKDKYKNIIVFILPRFDNVTAPFKVSSMKKVDNSLTELGKENSKHWLVLSKEEVAKTEPDVAVIAREGDGNEATRKLWDNLQLNCDEVVDGEGDEGDEAVQLSSV